MSLGFIILLIAVHHSYFKLLSSLVFYNCELLSPVIIVICAIPPRHVNRGYVVIARHRGLTPFFSPRLLLANSDAGSWVVKTPQHDRGRESTEHIVIETTVGHEAPVCSRRRDCSTQLLRWHYRDVRCQEMPDDNTPRYRDTAIFRDVIKRRQLLWN